MSLYQNTQADFSLTSTWKVALTGGGGTQSRYEIYEGPTEASRTVTFPVNLPAGAIIARAWLQVTFTSSPKGGIKYQRVNGEVLPSSGVLDVKITQDMTSYAATFSFASHGTVEGVGSYSGSLGIGSPTLYVDYVDTAGGEVEGDPSAVASGAKGLRLPRLLGKDLHEQARLTPTALSIDLRIDPLSTAEIKLPWDGPAVNVDDFVEIFDPYGSVGIFRAYRVTQRAGRSRSASLRHGIVTLADDIVLDGNAISAPVGQVFASLFAMQNTVRWVLGDCEVDPDLEIVLQRTRQSLMAAFSDLTAQLPDVYAWEFDQTTSPWRAHLRAMPAEEACEFRLNRNIASLDMTIDRDAQCTRLYAYGSGEGLDRIGLDGVLGTPYLDADSIEERGIIAKSITHEDIYDALTLRDVAQLYIDRHKDPTVSIRLSGQDVHAVTGLSIDQLHMGRLCRVPMPDLGMVLHERVVGISWRDVISRPSEVTATLANRLRDIADELAELMRQATRGKLIGGTVKTEELENHNDSVTQSSSLDHYFSIAGYGNTVSVMAAFSPANCRLVVDGISEIPSDVSTSGSVNLLRYLKADDNGVPVVGSHRVSYFARGAGTISVSSKISIKTIEKR